VSLVETLVSMALTIALSGTVLSLVMAGQTIARTQPETTDLQQRASCAAHGRERTRGAAGVAPTKGGSAVAFPPVTPSSGGGLTIWTTTSADAQGMLAVSAAPGATMVSLTRWLSPGGRALAPGTSAIGSRPTDAAPSFVWPPSGLTPSSLRRRSPIARSCRDPWSPKARCVPRRSRGEAVDPSRRSDRLERTGARRRERQDGIDTPTPLAPRSSRGRRMPS
jgi:hypothetical protein